jgi:serine/threonine-protein kinase
LLGKVVSHYEVTGALGEGAMGEVYAARDTLLGRSVAIKILQVRGVATEESRVRLLQEARAASSLNHPNIVTIHDVVRDGDVDCIVMELVTGETLAMRLKRGPIPLNETLEILDRIADALAAAHASGIVHRDLKPANVMLTSSGGLKILDFGLAKLFANTEDDPDARTAFRTDKGIIVGTPSFMSPEQVLGKPLDGRSDLFSLGSIAMEMLTGRNPFRAHTIVETMQKVAYGEAPSFENVPALMVPVLERLLARDKADRYQTADELRTALAELRAGAVSQTLRLKERSAAVRAPMRRRFAVVMAAVTLIAVGIAASRLWRRTGSTFVAPVTARDHVVRGNALLSAYWRRGYIDQAREEFQRAIAIDPKDAAAHAGLAMAYWRQYDRDDDRAWLELALKNGRHAVALNPELTSARVALGVAELSGGDTAAARKRLEATLVTDPGNATAHRWLGEAAARTQDDKTAEAELRKAVALRANDVELHSALGSFLYRNGRYDDAAAEFRRAASLAPDYASAYRNLGAALHMRGDYAGAAGALQQSLEIEPDATVYSNLGTLYFFQGLYPQSVTAFEKALQLGANNHLIWANLGDAYRWTPGNQDKAREAFTTALHLLADEIRAHPDDATLQSRRALYLAKQGDGAGALSVAGALMARNEQGPQNLYRIALAFELAGARAKSLSALAAALRNGYSSEEVKVDPELASLRRDVQYQRMMVAVR